MVWIKFIWMNKAEILGRDRLARISASPHRNSIQSPIHSVCPFPGYTCVSSRTSTRTEEMATWRLNSMWRHHGNSRRPNTCRVTPRPHPVGIFNGGTVPFYINEADFTARAWHAWDPSWTSFAPFYHKQDSGPLMMGFSPCGVTRKYMWMYVHLLSLF